MNRLDELFNRKNKRVLNVYCTAGFPFFDSTMEVMRALQDNGADLIELGMPYSDPLADGPVIQSSSSQAIANGMTIYKLFEVLKGFRQEINVPVVLMGYMNPVLQFGFEKFCASCAAVGIDGLILPDLPIFEFENEYASIIKKHGLRFIFLVTPETSEERIRKLDSLSTGFLYAVSSSSTTGNERNMEQQISYFRKLKEMKLNNPVLVGFGIKNKQTFDTACAYANGAIIGTAYIRAVEKARTSTESIESITKDFIHGIIG
jgi:tryptophan synthase alpha chain